MIAALVYFGVALIGVLLFEQLGGIVEAVDVAILRAFAKIRTPFTVDASEIVNLLASRWTIRILRWGTLLLLMVFRRWRHLIVYVGALIVLEAVSYQIALFISRPRPLDVTILGPWQGFAMPSRPLASLAVSLMGVLYTLVPHGRWRDRGKWAVGVILGALVLVRIVLAVDHPTSAVAGAMLGVTVGLAMFRLLTPSDVFPVTYQRGKSAHLDVGGRRGEAIEKAVADQVGEHVVEVEPIGLEGSGGSMPIRLTIERDDGERRYVFGKVYAMSHVRADRWYKLGRTILYGALEDETPFGSVRRFVEYEDYALRLLYDEELPTPAPYGVVELSPEREYMILMQFFDGAVEIGEADVDEGIINEGLELVRRLWDLGFAHRDIKPANLMVDDEHLRLIDVFFVQVRPSPWRQAVDLANMMLVLALRTDAATVYERALEYFTPDDVAEAFAAARGVAMPTQLRTMMKDDGRDLVEEFRKLAPTRRPIRIQRWTFRRMVLTAWVALLALIGSLIVASNWAVFA